MRRNTGKMGGAMQPNAKLDRMSKRNLMKRFNLTFSEADKIDSRHVRDLLGEVQEFKAKNGYPDDRSPLVTGFVLSLIEKRQHMQPNFFRSKPKTAAQLEEERIVNMRNSQEWKDFYRGITSDFAMRGAKPPPPEERKAMADAQYEEYHGARRRRAETGIARNPRRRMRRNSAAIELHAQPYSPEGRGFYFSSPEEYQEKYDKEYSRNRIEEYEIQFINGEDLAQSLFEAMKVSQGNLDDFFELADTLDSMPDDQKIAVLFLMEDRMMPAPEALEKSEEVILFEGSLEDAAADYFDNVGEIPQDTANMYFDYSGFGRDLAIGGDDVQGAVEQIEELQDSDDESDIAEAESLQEWVDNIESMTDQERAEEYVDSIGGVEELGEAVVSRYFDFEAFGRDADMNGDWTTFSFEGTDYVVMNALEF